MSTSFEIPVLPTQQRFAITLNGTEYRCLLVWNYVSLCWKLDIADTNGVPILSGVPLVTSLDLLTQFEYLGIGGGLLAVSDTKDNPPPTFANLGSIGHLYFTTP